jgi:DNA-binding transcriptional LysR family regulator
LATSPTAEAELRSIAKLNSGLTRVGAFASAWATILPLAVARFVNEHPNVTVTLVEIGPQAAQSALRVGELDLAVTFGYPLPEPAHDDGLQRIALADDHLVIGLPTGHRLAHEPSL